MSTPVLSRRTKVGASGILTISFCAASALDRAVCRSVTRHAQPRINIPFKLHGLAGPCPVLNIVIAAPCFSCYLTPSPCVTPQVVPFQRSGKIFESLPPRLQRKSKRSEAVQHK